MSHPNESDERNNHDGNSDVRRFTPTEDMQKGETNRYVTNDAFVLWDPWFK